MMNNILKIIVVFTFIVFVAFFSIGILNLSSGFKNQITVTGFAKKDISNQIAEFTINFTSENKEKSSAEKQNNEKVAKFLNEVKEFGISEESITTESLNVYQKQENYSEMGTFRTKLTDWVFSQSIKIKLKDVSKVNDFTNLASRNESSNIYGPNFSVDTQNIDETEVYNMAFENAKKKAEGIASKSERTLGKAMYITEGYNSPNPFPMMARALGVGGADSQAQLPVGTSEVSKTLNVVFELR